MAAFRRAWELGADMIELDVQPTSDRELVVIHDETVDRTTDGCGRVGDLTLRELKRLDAGSWFESEFSGETIPTLEETLDGIEGTIWLNIELKRFGDTPHYEDHLVDAFDRYDLGERGYLATRHAEVAMEIERIDPSVMRILIQGSRSEGECVSTAVDLGVEVVQIGRPSLSRDFVERIHDEGIRVFLFYADSPDEMVSSVDMGVDGVLTNWPGRMIGLVSRMGTD